MNYACIPLFKEDDKEKAMFITNSQSLLEQFWNSYERKMNKEIPLWFLNDGGWVKKNGNISEFTIGIGKIKFDNPEERNLAYAFEYMYDYFSMINRFGRSSKQADSALEQAAMAAKACFEGKG